MSLLLVVLSYIGLSIIETSRVEDSNVADVVSGSGPNFMAIVIFAALLFFFSRYHTKFIKLITGYFLGVVCYEFIQLNMSGRVFDWFDILFSFIGLGFVLLLAIVFNHFNWMKLNAAKAKNIS
ncbi:hypothetical protein [Thalassotalea sp. PS06]|uniref:hypothetical protein n=1 Tax=Thalassotalea sp. PS06 TaxID=2594005 RepID=UPI0011630411|nr:hypothetical protein [Thalassotalea sp. PS06]QDO99924.1 hypothetical protein FNC98_00330 [Thalassotalea sp. PS06]